MAYFVPGSGAYIGGPNPTLKTEVVQQPVEQALQQTMQQPIAEPKPQLLAQNGNQDVGVQLDFTQTLQAQQPKKDLKNPLVYSKAISSYMKDKPEDYARKINAHRFRVDRLENIITDFQKNNIDVTPENIVSFINAPLPSPYPMSTQKSQTMSSSFSKGILPKQWENKSPQEQTRFINNYLLLRKSAKELSDELAQKNIDTDYKNFLAQKFNETTVLTKESGKNNWGGIKLKGFEREQLETDLDKKTNQLLENQSYSFKIPSGNTIGATYKKTFETLDAKNKEDAIEEAKQNYGNVFGQKLLKKNGEPILFKQDGKWNVRILDLFANFNSSEQFMEEFKHQIRRRIIPK